MDLSIINSVLSFVALGFVWKSRSHPIAALKMVVVPPDVREELRALIYVMMVSNSLVVTLLIASPSALIGLPADQLSWLRFMTRVAAIVYVVWATRLVARFIVRYSFEHVVAQHIRART